MIAAMGYEHILVEIEPPIATVTLNRPKVLNALSPAVIGEVCAALSELEADGNVQAAVLTGGPKVFAAGADIQDMADQGAVDQLLRDQTGRWAPLAGFKKPLIAAVNGYELGIVNKVVPWEMTIAVAKRIARDLAAKPPLAVRLAKEAVLKAFDAPLSDGLAAERKSFYFLFATEDQKEGMHAFLEKRKGVFKGR